MILCALQNTMLISPHMICWMCIWAYKSIAQNEMREGLVVVLASVLIAAHTLENSFSEKEFKGFGILLVRVFFGGVCGGVTSGQDV
jgi:hypothetical protein